MSERARELADNLAQATGEFIGFIEGLDDAQWTARCADEEGTVAAVASHVGGGFRFQVSALLRPIAEGTEIPNYPRATIDRGNIDYLAKNANRPKEEALAMLREQGGRAVEYIRGLTDEQLARSGALPLFDNASFTADAVIEQVMLAHVRGHLASMRESVTRNA